MDTVPSLLRAECTTEKPHGQTWYCLHVDSIFSLASPPVGSLGICHLLYRWSLSLFLPGFTPNSLESSAEGVVPGVHHTCVHHNIAKSAHVFECLSICGRNTDNSTLIWTILNFPSLPMAISGNIIPTNWIRPRSHSKSPLVHALGLIGQQVSSIHCAFTLSVLPLIPGPWHHSSRLWRGLLWTTGTPALFLVFSSSTWMLKLSFLGVKLCPYYSPA